MNKKIIKNSFFYLTSSLLPSLVGFIMLPVYSIYLTPKDYGIVALVLSFQVFLPIIYTFKLDSSISRFYFEYDTITFKVFVTTLLLIISVISIIITFLLHVFLNEILRMLFPKTSVNYYGLFQIGIYTSFFSVYSSIFKNLIRVQQKAKLFMKISVILFMISLGINVFEIIILRRGARGILEASLISSIILFMVLFFFNRQFVVSKINFRILVDPFKYSLPIIPHSLAGLIFMYSDRFILEKYVSLSAIGLYLFADKISSVFKMLVNEFNTAFSPHFMELSNKSKENAIRETQQISVVFVYITSMLIVCFSLFSVEIVYYLFDKEYFDVWKMIPLLSSAYIFRNLYSFSSCGLFFEKKTGRIAMITVIAGIVNIILNIFLIPIYGVISAVYSTIVSFAITFILSEIFSRNIYNLKLDFLKIIIIIIYLYLSIFISIKMNSNFHNFRLKVYLYKGSILGFGFLIGYILDLFNKRSIWEFKR